MPAVLCGLDCFDAPSLPTARDVAREFSASLHPALAGGECAVEVYRLERVLPDAPLTAEEAVVCCLPGWRFDFAALEEMHSQLEDLRSEHEILLIQYSRTQEALISLNTSIEAGEAMETPQRRGESGRGDRREVHQLRQQLIQSEKKQQETKATVMALRSEFMHLVDMMSDAGASKDQPLELPVVMKELDANVKYCYPQETARSPRSLAAYDAEKLGSAGCAPGGSPVHAADAGKPARHVSQPPVVPGCARRPAGGPTTPGPSRSTGPTLPTPTPRPGARLRGVGVHQRGGGHHSAGAGSRQRPPGDSM